MRIYYILKLFFNNAYHRILSFLQKVITLLNNKIRNEV
jgi:hypothetical protein